MFAPPPQLHSITLYSKNYEILVDFYSELGMLFNVTVTKEGVRAAQYTFDEFKFVICESLDRQTNIELNFIIDAIDEYMDDFKRFKCEILIPPFSNELGRHIIIRDPDKNLLRLTCKKTYT